MSLPWKLVPGCAPQGTQQRGGRGEGREGGSVQRSSSLQLLYIDTSKCRLPGGDSLTSCISGSSRAGDRPCTKHLCHFITPALVCQRLVLLRYGGWFTGTSKAHTSHPPFAPSITASAAIKHVQQDQRRSRSCTRHNTRAAVEETLHHSRAYQRCCQHQENFGLLSRVPTFTNPGSHIPMGVISKSQGWDARR